MFPLTSLVPSCPAKACLKQRVQPKQAAPCPLHRCGSCSRRELQAGDARACWPWAWPPPVEPFARGAVTDERPWESTWQPILGQLCEGLLFFLRCLHSSRWDRLRLEGQRRETGAASSTFCLAFPHPGTISMLFFFFFFSFFASSRVAT